MDQPADAALVLHGALVCLNRGGVCREPFTPGMFARPNAKGLQSALYLLHHRIRSAARTKKELQHVYPVLEPAQAREFKAAMQAWVRELGAAGAVGHDTVKYFVSAYHGSSQHRTTLMLLDLCALALAKDLGPEGPHSTLPGAEALQPGAAAAGAQAGAQAAAALRHAQARLDAVVAAMQRLKQLHAQAVGQLAGGQAASGAPAQQLAPRVPPLFSASQASVRRGELVAELLTSGPPLTGKPEAVSVESWADVLATGRAPAAAGVHAASPALARRLSNPAQEASNFAAEALAADADGLAVHHVLVQRLAASGAALQAAAAAGSTLDSAELRSALAEAAACREALMLSVRQELAAAKMRQELQAPPTSAGSNTQPSMLRLLPPSLPPCNPVLEGLQAPQHVAADPAEATGSGGGGWGPPDAAAVQAVRRSMWQQARQEAGSPAAAQQSSVDEAWFPDWPRPCAQEGATPLASASQLTPTAGAANGSSSSRGRFPGVRSAAAVEVPSPSFEDVVSLASMGLNLADVQLLSKETADELDGLPAGGFGSPLREQQPPLEQHPRLAPAASQQAAGGHVRMALPLSPYMAESCASASVVAENDSSGSAAAAAGAGRQRTAHGRPLRLAVSPMLSAAASFMPTRQAQQEQHWPAASAQQQACRSSSGQPPPASGLPAGAGLSPPRPLLLDSPGCGGYGLAALHRLDSSSGQAGSTPVAPQASGSERRRSASVAFTLTPPRRLADSPALQAAAGSGEATPTSHMAAPSWFAGGEDSDEWQQPAGPALEGQLRTQQQQQQRQQQEHGDANESPGLFLASCLKGQPAGLKRSPFAPPLDVPLDSPRSGSGHQSPQPARWALAAARSGSPAAGLDSPLSSGRASSMGRRRSALHTTSSPACRGSRHDAAGVAGGVSPLLTPPRSLMATPDGPGCHSRMQEAGEPLGRMSSLPKGGNGISGTLPAAGRMGSSIDALRERLKNLGVASGPRAGAP